MPSELHKIVDYFNEGGRIWGNDPEFAIGRRFYEMWETGHKPGAFELNDPQVEILGHVMSLPGSPPRVGFFEWDENEACASMVVEARDCEQKFLLLFSDGSPAVQETEPEYLDLAEVSLGERLEVVYDVIRWFRKHRPVKDVRLLSKKEFCGILEKLASKYSSRVVNTMQREPAGMLKRLVRKATEDMAADELSNQLALPLDGTYAVRAAPTREQDPAEQNNTKPPGAGDCLIPARTTWRIARELQYLLSACNTEMDLEHDLMIKFTDARRMPGAGETDGTAISLHGAEDIALKEGTRLLVFKNGQQKKIGTFDIDVHDGKVIYGRLKWDDPDRAPPPFHEIFARPIPSPVRFVAALMGELLQQLKQDGGFDCEAANAALGISDSSFSEGDHSRKAPTGLDSHQARAWRAAVYPWNPIVLIQGPPGTGKTSVLEKVARTLCGDGLRVLVTAPSNTAVDNICRRVLDLPVLRFGKRRESIARDIAGACWIKDIDCVREFASRRRAHGGGGIYAGTHIGLLKDKIVQSDLEKNGIFDVIIFDEAGMASMKEFLLCCRLGSRAVLFGDHQQLPPFPPSRELLASVHTDWHPVSRKLDSILTDSALQWLAEARGFPVVMMQRSYRCQNPRLMRFSSTLFYDARVKTSHEADYYRLTYAERQQKYPAETLRLYRTGLMPESERREQLIMAGNRPGLENRLEALICTEIVYEAVRRYPLEEITVITPYRRQVRLIRRMLDFQKVKTLAQEGKFSKQEWESMVHDRVATVDSFQGGESDVVIISYVRSNTTGSIGFVDDPNRVNVAHTRCRREMTVIGDIDHLKKGSDNGIFERMERAFERDGAVIDVTPEILQGLTDGQPRNTRPGDPPRRVPLFPAFANGASR